MNPTHKPKKMVNSTKKKVGKFVIDFTKMLGKGQFGQVYVAENQQTKQEVAVKTIKKDQMYQDKYTKDALVRQIEIMRSLKSPNIIQFIEISETPNNIYIFQQIANSGTLDDLLNKNKRFEEKVALEYIVQILTGFEQLVKHGIIHRQFMTYFRDIKPTNLLVKDKVIKIADFGMSRYSGKLSLMVSQVGTPYYMAPQILSKTKYSFKCDIWSLGVLFYQLVTGTLPWKRGSSSHAELLTQIKDQCMHGVQFPANLKISNDYKDLVNGCLKYEDEDRFDWDSIFGHKIFQGKFKNTGSGIDSFTLTELRVKIHCNNVNLGKIVSKLPEKLTKQDFTNFLRALNDEITAAESANLFKRIVKDKETIALDQIMKYLESHGIKREGLKGKEVPQIQSVKARQALMERIAKGIEDKKIDLFDLYKKFDKNKQNKLYKQEFQNLIQSICSDISIQDIDSMFLYFNAGEHKMSLAFETFYENFCKAVQIPALKDEKVSEGIKKMEERKKTT